MRSKTDRLSSFEFQVITLNDKGEEIRREQREAKYYSENLSNSVALDMVAIPAGSFWMGTEDREIKKLCQTYEKDWFRRESPQHEVTLPTFFMGRYPITQAQWRVVAGWEEVEQKLEPDPSYFKKPYRGIDRWTLPVDNISWDDAKEFCARLSNKTKKEYRLPTEAEWEYACRAGTTTPFHFGETISTDLANYRGTDGEFEGKIYPGNYGRGLKGVYREQTTPVGYFKSANAFGLCDLHGQVWEWCRDDWHNNYDNAPNDSSAREGENSNKKVIRGGSWYLYPYECRSGSRGYISRDKRFDVIGFRVMCVAPH